MTIINTLPREGRRSGQRGSVTKEYRTKPYKLCLRPGLDPAKLNQLVDEAEIDAYREDSGGSRGQPDAVGGVRGP